MKGDSMKLSDYFKLRDFDRIPLIGSEKGDRAEIERIFAGTFTLPAGQPTIISRELPVGDPWLAMRINLRGQIVGAAGAAGTVLSDGPLKLWQLALTTDIDRDVIEPSVSAVALWNYAKFLNGTSGDIVAPTVVAATTTDFNAVVTIPFADPLMAVPMDSVLDTRRYNSVTLTITTGVITDIIDSATLANATLGTCFADIEIVRVSPRVPLPLTTAKILPFYKRHAAIVPAADTFINLDRIPTLAIKRICVRTAGGAGVAAAVAGVPFSGTGVNTILDTMRVSSNYRDHFGSALGGVSRRTLQGGNKENYACEAAWPAGWYVADFVLDGSNWSALATGDKSVLQAIFSYQAAPPANIQLAALVAGVQKLRGAEGA